ncbi:MAG TPA: hypothetical protein PKE30_02070, partial [Niabella sp.]|nr:hypothetical protein [Niabella sp.]
MKQLLSAGILLTIAFSLFNTKAVAQPAIQWQKSLGGSGVEQAHDVQPTPDGGYIVAGYTASNDGDVSGHHGGQDYWVVKLDNTGFIQWQKALGGSGHDQAHSIQPVVGSGYIVAGYTWSNDGDVTGNHGVSDYWVVKLDNAGDIEWQKCLGGSIYDEAYSVQPVADGGYIVAGFSWSNDGDVTGNHNSRDYWIVKLNNTGNIEWQKSLGGSSDEYAYSVQPVADGGYIVAGYTWSNDGDVTGNHGSGDYWVVKLNNNGNIEWQKCLGGSGHDQAHSVLPVADGYIVAGYSQSTGGDVSGNHGADDYWVVKLNNSGDIEWQKALGGSGQDIAQSVQSVANGYIVAGISLSIDGDVTGNHGSGDYWVVKLNSDGDMQWQKSLGSGAIDWAYSIQPASDGGYIVAGYSGGNGDDVTGNHGNFDAWIVKLATDPALPVTFGGITAAIKNNNLLVNFTSLTEVNNDRFVIEISADGKHFKEAGILRSRATAGNSDTA